MRPLQGYPQAVGSKWGTVFPHAGPSTYTPITPGAAPANATGGDSVDAAEAGMKYFDYMVAGLTDSGVYRVECIPVNRSGVIGSNSIQPGAPGTTYILRWVVVATGDEAGAIDLSEEIVRLFALGQ